MKAICVDDDQQALGEIVSCCKAQALLEDTQGFSRPRDALDFLGAHPADLTVLDIAMPDMNGIELAQEIRKSHPHLPIIFVSAHPQYALASFQAIP